MAVTTLGNITVGNPITLTDGASYIISDIDRYLSGVTVNSISDVDFTINNAADITAVDFSHTHNDIYYTETELNAGQLNNIYYTKTELNTSGSASVHYGNLTNVPSNTSTNTMLVSRTNVTYEDTTVTIINLPIGAVIWDIKFEVTELFDGDDPTGNGIIIGNNIDSVEYYLTSTNGLDTTGWKTLTLSNIPNRMNVSKNITIEYQSSNGTETQGSATIYVYYTLF